MWLWGAHLPNALWALHTLWARSLVAEMKLLLGLAGLLAVLIMLQPSEGALPGNSSETGKAGMLRVVLSPWDS